MMTLCKTGRGRIACGLGGLTVAVLALACLWAGSSAVTAGDDSPTKKEVKPSDCPLPSLPVSPKPPRPPVAPPPATAISLPPVSPAPVAPDKRPAADDGALLTPSQVAPSQPPVPSNPAPEPPLAKPTVTGTAPPPVARDPLLTSPTPQPVSSSEGQDIKQLLARLAEIKSERTKLDERERQTIQSVKRKFQEQKRALEQLERELRQLGISCTDSAADTHESGNKPAY